MSMLGKIRDAVVDEDVLARIAADMALRRPNREAIHDIALALSDHYDRKGRIDPFEAVVVSATGVGKTYVLAGALEYLVEARGVHNFAVITPGATILNKTVVNFTPGHPKSLRAAMTVQPVVITAENFASPAMRAAMDDPERIKLYVFTVQSLIRPTTKVGRRTHKFQEGLGTAFYEYLESLSDLVIFADEHHCYYGLAFSEAIRSLHPCALVGLTATPHERTPAEQIIYRYPLAFAVADHLVKTPVIVGRKDERDDPETKLNDGARLLELKSEAMERWATTHGRDPVHPVMLVIAGSIVEAKEYAAFLQSSDFREGRYSEPGTVLVVTSHSPDEALQLLDSVEDPASPVRIIVSVGMLKEGWDVKNVYVICSMRASVSDILTEQTLGRGLRLPFGTYTGEEFLDTLEVVAHERYDDLMRRSGLLADPLVQYRVRTVERRMPDGTTGVGREETVLPPPLSPAERADSTGLDRLPESLAPANGSASGDESNPAPVPWRSEDQEGREAAGRHDGPTILSPRDGFPSIEVPLLRTEPVPQVGSLIEVATDHLGTFRQLGQRMAQNPDDELRRVLVKARVVDSPEGIKQTVVELADAQDRIQSLGLSFNREESVSNLRRTVLAAPFVHGRLSEIDAAEAIVQAFVDGLGDKAETVLSAYLDRLSYRLLQAIRQALKATTAQPKYREVLTTKILGGNRVAPATPASDARYGAFIKHQRYAGWRRSLYSEAWFDSAPERDVANLLDNASAIVCWVRLQRDDVPILWQAEDSSSHKYQPDFVAVDAVGVHWLIEVKADNEMHAYDVRRKREAARRWANRVSLDRTLNQQWRYVLASETDINLAHGDWTALSSLAEE